MKKSIDFQLKLDLLLLPAAIRPDSEPRVGNLGIPGKQIRRQPQGQRRPGAYEPTDSFFLLLEVRREPRLGVPSTRLQEWRNIWASEKSLRAPQEGQQGRPGKGRCSLFALSAGNPRGRKGCSPLSQRDMCGDHRKPDPVLQGAHGPRGLQGRC